MVPFGGLIGRHNPIFFVAALIGRPSLVAGFAECKPGLLGANSETGNLFDFAGFVFIFLSLRADDQYQTLVDFEIFCPPDAF
jgi:hypothetical protein